MFFVCSSSRCSLGNLLHAACESECAKAVPGAASVISYPGETIVDTGDSYDSETPSSLTPSGGESDGRNEDSAPRLSLPFGPVIDR